MSVLVKVKRSQGIPSSPVKTDPWPVLGALGRASYNRLDVHGIKNIDDRSRLPLFFTGYKRHFFTRPGDMLPLWRHFSGAYCNGGNAMHYNTRLETSASYLLIVNLAKRMVYYFLYILIGETLILVIYIA